MKTREGVEAIITHLSRRRYGEGMVQTTHGFQPAAKAEVVGIILWFSVQVRVGPPSNSFQYPRIYLRLCDGLVGRSLDLSELNGVD